MGISFSGMNNIGANQMITSCNNGEPNWLYIPTKGKSNKTQQEFVVEIKELAQKAATATSKGESEYISKQVLRLRTEYISEVSPDRKLLYQQAKSSMKKHSQSVGNGQGVGELTLLDFLNKSEQGNSLANKGTALAGGGILTHTILTTGGYGVEINCQGAKVLINQGNGWGYEMTSSELARKDEFYSIYWNEYEAVKKGESSLIELPDYLEEKPSLDIRA
ncbi:MAG: hypothetical protein IJF03_10735 [Lachnospiraceae bacterium]|nr:hypothetical protein [Lachnospiraceae bacterium]